MSSVAPRPLPLLALVVVCFAGGAWLSHASLDVDRARLATQADSGDSADAVAFGPSESDAAPSAPAGPPGAEADATRPGTNGSSPGTVEGGPPSAAPVAAQPDAGALPLEDVALATPPPAPARGPVTVRRGRVAYLRCEGLAAAPAPGACPRDTTVERRVWDAIDALPACPGLVGTTGAIDVRVVFDGPRMSGLGFRELGVGGPPPEAVRGCLEPSLANLATSLGTSRMTAAFRFDLVPAP